MLFAGFDPSVLHNAVPKGTLNKPGGKAAGVRGAVACSEYPELAGATLLVTVCIGGSPVFRTPP